MTGVLASGHGRSAGSSCSRGRMSSMSDLLPPLADAGDKEAIRFQRPRAELRRAVRRGRRRRRDRRRNLARGRVRRVAPRDVRRGDRRARGGRRPVHADQPQGGRARLEHIVSDSAPELVLTAAGAELGRSGRCGVDVDGRPAATAALPDEPDAEAPAVIVYTSGTTGPPKGAVLPRRAISSNLDALADAWEWTGDDVLAQALPLFHVHGLILGVLGPVRLGGTVHHLERFDSQAMAAELGGRRRCSASRRCTTGSPPTPSATPRSAAQSAERACSSPARPRCPPPSTPGSRSSPASRSSSATA